MIDILLWYVWMQVFAISGWLITSHWLHDLPDRGYGISKAIGVILAGFAYWWLVTLGLAPNAPGAIVLAIILVALTGIALHAYGSRGPQRQPLIHLPGLSVIVATEVVFGVAFLACTIYRSYTPQIVEAGGEKFMESMFINAILRSPSFPPNDAWLSGYTISYYYFGYILLAMLTRISGVAPSIGFNLGGAMVFALTIVSAFSVGFNLWGTFRRTTAGQSSVSPVGAVSLHSKNPTGSPILAGLLAAIMLGVMGNMGGLMESIRCTGILPQSFWSWLDIRQIAQQPIQCSGLLPTRFYWWWDWSRVIHDYTPTGANQEVITETPAFSFILGDNHPHVMDLPFVLCAVTLALYFLTSRRFYTDPATASPGDGSTHRIKLDGQPAVNWLMGAAPHMLLAGVVVGGLGFMNTWDFPVYGVLVGGAVLLGRWYRREPILPGVLFGLSIFVLGYLFYIPFYSVFASQARGIGVNLFNGTRFVQFFMMFAPFIVAAPLFAAQTFQELRLPPRRIVLQVISLALAALVFALFAVVVLGVSSAQGRAYLAELNASGSVMGVSREVIMQRLIGRLTDPWTPIFLLLVAASCAVLVLTRPHAEQGVDLGYAESTPPAIGTNERLIKSFVLLLFLGGALLTVAVEFIFLQDLFGTRMNTVFKFYYQAWTVWAIASSFALMTFLEQRHLLATVGSFTVVLLLLAGLLYPLYAAISKTDDFSGPPTLDGSAYLQSAHPEDARIIAWLNRNVQGAPVILETPADHYGSYVYNGRISVFTGLPTLLGWAGHENQWRGNYDVPAQREPLIKTLYNTTDVQQAEALIQQFHIRYVIVGQLERTTYSSDGLAKFRQMCRIDYQTGRSLIYECNP